MKINKWNNSVFVDWKHSNERREAKRMWWEDFTLAEGCPGASFSGD